MVPPSQTTPGYLSSLFLVPKKGGGQRPVVNLKPLNQFLPYEHFKMEGIHMVRDLLRKGDFMVKIDLKDAYFTVPLCLAHQKFVRFSWEGTLYEFACLPFGLSIAPRVFTKIMKPVVALLRQLGIRLIIYLDDLLIMAQSKEMLNCHASTTLHLLENLGFMINYLKSVLIPATTMEFLGFLIDSQAMTLALPRDKVRKVKKECQSALNHPQVTVRELAKLLGHLTSTIQAVFPGPLHFRHLQGDKNKALAHLGSYDSRVQLSLQALEELIWWRDNLDAWNGKSLISGSPDLRISGSHNRNRRIPQGLGGLLHVGCYGRSVVPRRISATHQLSRAPSRSLCNKDLCKIQSSNESSPTDGQRFCGPLHQQNGGNKIISPSSSSHRSMGMVLTTQNSSRGPVSPRCLKYKGRQGVQGHVRSSRLEIRPVSIYKVKSVVGAPRGGPVRISSVHPASSLLQLETRPSGRSCGCFLPRLELGKGVRIPPFCTHRQVPQKDSRSAGFLFSSSSTCVASSALVPLTPRDVCCSSSSPSSVSGLGNSYGGSTPLSNLQLAGRLLSSNPTLRRKFQKGLKTSWLQPGGREPHQPIRQLGESGMAGAVNGKLIQFMPQ